jgi:hypothetical protein
MAFDGELREDKLFNSKMAARAGSVRPSAPKRNRRAKQHSRHENPPSSPERAPLRRLKRYRPCIVSDEEESDPRLLFSPLKRQRGRSDDEEQEQESGNDSGMFCSYPQQF